ncbi:short chain dehydrogenase [Chitinimonas sp. BJB300]|uniref:short chain dehydrogenase n=1 Tax=Chitinimonas sp. BJB300 TaxID=1559339 RepID=UPI000C1164B2|nr:short chain dehydrogenase [Chitinimonas sp. BJB300]PHV13210.1 short chain dehydrogenase [Chitinimonas sp. BJB300]TSJ89601.1 short chain dehydrogenase [Chitinimonas sp. BJB300]
MKVVLFGATGTIGKAVLNELSARHEVVRVGRSSEALQNKSIDYQADMTDLASVEQLFAKVGKVDAIVSAAGGAPFISVQELTPTHMLAGLQDKLMGQVNLVVAGQPYLNDGGSFTLISGVLSHDPIRYGVCVSTINSAIDGFVRGTAIELARGLRINAVSPTVVEESMASYAPYFRGFVAVSASRVALAYSKSVEGLRTGQVFAVL